MKEQSFETVSVEELEKVVGGHRHHPHNDWDRRVAYDVGEFMHGLIDGLA